MECQEKQKSAKRKKSLLSDFFLGTPEGIRTPDLLVRSQTLYPTELPAHTLISECLNIIS